MLLSLTTALVLAQAPPVVPTLPLEVWERLLREPGVVAAPALVRGAVLPHHFVAGTELTKVYRGLAESVQPELVVVISPNHFERGVAPVITTRTPQPVFDGEFVPIARQAVNALVERGVVAADDTPFDKEHGVGLHVQYLHRFFPNAKVLPLVVKAGASDETIDAVAAALGRTLDPAHTLVVLSMDCAHFLPLEVAEFHDVTTLAALRQFELAALPSLDTDTAPGARLFLRLMQGQGAQASALLAHTNSQQWSNTRLSETTSHLYVAFSPGTPDLERTVTLQFFGDAFFGRSVAQQLTPVAPRTTVCPVSSDERFYGVFDQLEGTEKRFFRGTNCTVLNLEGVFAAGSRSQPQGVVLTQPDEVPQVLQHYGFCAASLGNNHALDHFREGLDATRAALEAHHVAAPGDFTVSDVSCQRVVRGGLRVSLCSFNDVVEQLSLTNAVTAVRRERSEADVVIALLHAGHEHHRDPSERQRTVAHALIDAGADALVGHHPHVVQPAETYLGRPIFYSLGNFVFDALHPDPRWTGLSVGLAFTVTEQRVRARVWLFPLDSSHGKPRLAGPGVAEPMRAWLSQSLDAAALAEHH